MALITCPHCGREGVSDKALWCPGCGYNVKEHFYQQNLFQTRKHLLQTVEDEYEAQTACDRNNFILDVTVVPGNVHDSVSFDGLYDKVTARFPEIEVVTVDAGYKTPWICKKIIDDGRIPFGACRRTLRE